MIKEIRLESEVDKIRGVLSDICQYFKGWDEIETQWNVNYLSKDKCNKISDDEIETQWNVNFKTLNKDLNVDFG